MHGQAMQLRQPESSKSGELDDRCARASESFALRQRLAELQRAVASGNFDALAQLRFKPRRQVETGQRCAEQAAIPKTTLPTMIAVRRCCVTERERPRTILFGLLKLIVR
jgi:hypothetical protein